MTNIDIQEQAIETIETIADRLDQGRIKRLFDDPIDNATRQFRHDEDCPPSPGKFHKVLVDFITHIYGKGLNARWKLFPDPLSEVIALLEAHYQSNYGHGYIAAVMDAGDAGEGGIDAVLQTLSQIIKDTERQKYLRSIFAINLEAADWYLQCEIVRVLLENYRPFLPEQILQCETWELVSQIPSMIALSVNIDSTFQKILSYPPESNQIPGVAGLDDTSVVTPIFKDGVE